MWRLFELVPRRRQRKTKVYFNWCLTGLMRNITSVLMNWIACWNENSPDSDLMETCLFRYEQFDKRKIDNVEKSLAEHVQWHYWCDVGELAVLVPKGPGTHHGMRGSLREYHNSYGSYKVNMLFLHLFSACIFQLVNIYIFVIIHSLHLLLDV